MKKKTLLFACLLSTTLFVKAQTADKTIAVGLNILKNEYKGDYGNGIFDFNQPTYAGGGISLSTYISHSFDLGIQASMGSYGYVETTVNEFSGSKFDASLFTHYKLNNGYILKKDAKLSPFISLGIGMATYGTINSATPYPTIITKGIDLIIPLGAGLKYQFTNKFAIQYQYLYNITNADNHDENRGPNFFGTKHSSVSGNDAFGEHLFGVVFSFYTPKEKVKKQKLNTRVSEIDTDGDGVADSMDKCPDTPKGVKVDANGCPLDSDGDGVADYLDKCPDTPAGTKVDANGCPEVKAEVVKVEAVKPEVKVEVVKPEVRTEVATALVLPIKNAQFETGKYNINKSYYVILDRVIKIMNENPGYTLEIKGHTDSKGSDSWNQKLSLYRANAIKQYLENNGISKERLTTKGFGKTMPVADNETAVGRAKNRRVEIKVN